MLKKEFLDVLNQKLSLISDKEREDIILEYGTYIDDKIAMVETNMMDGTNILLMVVFPWWY